MTKETILNILRSGILLLSLHGVLANAYTECQMSVDKVWLNLAGEKIWICFYGGGCIHKTLGNGVTERHLNSMYVSAMAAITASKALVVRYPENGYSCAQVHTVHRGDSSGFWLTK
jgi:hypothetical protein